jgi:hypothetical protein
VQYSYSPDKPKWTWTPEGIDPSMSDLNYVAWVLFSAGIIALFLIPGSLLWFQENWPFFYIKPGNQSKPDDILCR